MRWLGKLFGWLRSWFRRPAAGVARPTRAGPSSDEGQAAASLLGPAIIVGRATPVALLTTLVAMAAQVAEPWPIVAGVIAFVVAGAAVVIYLAFRGNAWSFNGRQYGEIQARLRTVEARLQGKGDGNGAPESPVASDGRLAASRHVAALKAMLSRRSIHWATGMGFVSAWADLHRAEEWLVLCADRPTVASWAREDEMRLIGSQVPHGDWLLNRLRLAVPLLDGMQGKPVASEVKPALAGAPTDEWDARAELMAVRYAIDSYRDGIWEQLVNAKSLLVAGTAAGWSLTYLTFVVLVLAGAAAHSLVSAAVFFAVGGLVGVISALSAQSMARSAEEDYGLGIARLYSSILLSGVAAVFGVALVTLLGPNALGGSLSEAASSMRGGAGPFSWSQAFDWHANLLGFIAAAAFGFAPARLFDLLRRDQADAVQKLQSSRSTGTKIS